MADRWSQQSESSTRMAGPAEPDVPPGRRLRITVAYDGTEFHGWQVQPGRATIQGVLQEIVSGIEGEPVHVAGSGRTDAGVHALGQVAAFGLKNPIPPDNLRKAINRLLPPAVRIVRAEEVDADFHPRFDAVAKTYRYTIFRGEIVPPFEARYVWHHPYPLLEEAMARAARNFEGEHNFRAFAAKDERYTNGQSTVRTVFSSALQREGERLIYTVRGAGFLKYMVRNMVGTLIEVGRGNLSAEGFPLRCGATVPARGLTLVRVEY